MAPQTNWDTAGDNLEDTPNTITSFIGLIDSRLHRLFSVAIITAHR